LVTRLFYLAGYSSMAQNDYLNAQAEVNEKIYTGGQTHEVEVFSQVSRLRKNQRTLFFSLWTA
jgi:hypothetical protein